jgi:hypothetical protein
MPCTVKQSLVRAADAVLVAEGEENRPFPHAPRGAATLPGQHAPSTATPYEPKTAVRNEIHPVGVFDSPALRRRQLPAPNNVQNLSDGRYRIPIVGLAA